VGLISSGKRFRVTLDGEIPPGIPDEQFAAFIAASVTVGLQLMAFLKSSNIECPYRGTDTPQPGARLHQ
jgi:hypothetical protein